MNKNQQEQEISFQSFNDLLEYVKSNETIYKSFIKAKYLIESFDNPCCSISGGKDSDIMLDIITRVDKDKKVEYVWFDTGIEYQATKDHLKYLEQKYGIEIHREKAVKPIPLSCKEYGQPFLSKHVSEMMYRLQKHNFKWEDEPFDSLIQKYPNCKYALLWWTNGRPNTIRGYSQFNINCNLLLKDFIIKNHPTFKISNKCCEYAKKKVGRNYCNIHSNDLNIIGVRKLGGGGKIVCI